MTNTGDTTYLVCVSDTHINSTVALAPPLVNLDDGGTYHASRGQRWVWESWLDFTEKVKALDGRKILLINGDMGELDTKRRSNQLITVNKSTIQRMAIDTLAPLVDIADSVIVIRGTMAHTGKAQWLEEGIARQYDHAIHDKACDNGSWYHFQGVIGGLRLDAAHHVSMGRLPWTAPNAANALAARVLWAYKVKLNQDPPHLTIRSHNHRYADSGRNYETRVICLPSWSLLTEYGYRMGLELDLADIGGVIVKIQGGKFTDELITYQAKESKRVWALKL